MDEKQTRVPMYRQVTDALVERIRSGAVSPDEPLCTEAALMEEFAISRITARRALEELEGRGLITRKRGMGCFVSRSAYEMLRGEAQPHTHGPVYALLLPHDLPKAQMQAFFTGANDVLTAHEAYAAIYLTGADENAPAVLERVSGMDIAGVIVLTDDVQPCGNALNRLLLDGKIAALAGCDSPFAHISSVRMNTESGAASLVHHLRALGHAKIAYFAQTLTSATPDAQQRLAAMLLALQGEGLRLDASCVCGSDDPQALRRCIAAGTTAFVAENSEIAHHLARDCVAMGLYIPGMASLCCWEVCEPLPPLRRKEKALRVTCLAQDCEALGRAAAEMALARAKQPISPAERHTLPLILSPGDTTAAVPPPPR